VQISGSSAVVFGGAGGLGEATVRRLHGAGVKVVIADLADDKGKELAGELGVPYVRTDVTSDDDVNAAIAAAEALGPFRISVDTHGGPAGGGRLVGKDGSPLAMEDAARDLSPLGIRVMSIAPGTINTPAYGKAADQLEAYWGPQVPFPKRMGRSDEYGRLALSIAENDYLNGETIRLDGALRFPPK